MLGSKIDVKITNHYAVLSEANVNLNHF